MENPVHEETRHGMSIKIYQDTDPQSPQEWGDDNLFLVGYHRSFSVEGPRIPWANGPTNQPKKEQRLLVDADDVKALLRGRKATTEAGEYFPAVLAKKYHVFGLEAYIHSGVALALSQEGNFCDRNFDVSQLGAVFVARSEWPTREKARKAARGLIETWNDALSGNVWGYEVEPCPPGEIGACWGFSGDWDGPGGALQEARAYVDSVTHGGKTDASGQLLFPWAPETAGAGNEEKSVAV